MPDAKKPDSHWCSGTADSWAVEFFAKTGSAGSYLARLQLLAHRHFYGALPNVFVDGMPSSAEVSREGDQGANVALRVNWLRAHANAKLQIIVAPKLTWSAQAVNTDSRSMADASRGSTILEAEWKQGPWEAASIEAMLGAVIYGEEFIFPYWNSVGGEALAYEEPQAAVDASPAVPESIGEDGAPIPAVPAVEAQPERKGRVTYKGELQCNAVAPWNAFCDNTAPSWDASPWCSARLLVDRFDLIAQYPDKEEEILKADSPPSTQTRGPNSTTINAQSDSAKVLCHYFFHKRTPGLPVGLQAVAISKDCVLAFMPLETCYRTPPVHQFKAGSLKGSPRGYTDFWEAMAAQDLATNIQSSIATNIVAFAKQMISAETGTDLAIDQIGNGPFVQYRPKGSPAPTPMTFHLPSDGAFKHLDAIRSDQRMMLGLNDVSMGEAPTGTPNAQAWALLATAGVTANSGSQRFFVDGVRRVGQSILAIWKEKADHERKTSVVGSHGAAVPKQESWDKSDLEPMGDVTVEIASPLAQTAAGRLQIEELYAKRGFVQVPEQLEMLLSTGTLQPLTQVLRDELIYIAWENEELLAGRTPPVMVTDSQQMHIREHKGVTFSAEARSNPTVLEAANKHIQMHVEQALSMAPNLAQLLGQAASAPAAPPGAEGPAGGPSALEQPGQPAGGESLGVKLPKPPESAATGSPVGPPGMPQ